jgi:hypothetical protein
VGEGRGAAFPIGLLAPTNLFRGRPAYIQTHAFLLSKQLFHATKWPIATFFPSKKRDTVAFPASYVGGCVCSVMRVGGRERGRAGVDASGVCAACVHANKGVGDDVVATWHSGHDMSRQCPLEKFALILVKIVKNHTRRKKGLRTVHRYPTCSGQSCRRLRTVNVGDVANDVVHPRS